ncbi:hypothetical protein [Hydrogenivirga sp. 128-5-R1-1]|uniref:hypothetical protein n=1 Tax=Hydrogenivirga sp. 128-5-R1-1 TaxID=392423 RepID=UPI00015F2CC8|nr:hypothetical protein [Hydrogenivirga sp. 128-5-R1-1]EDP74627.1 hypothetical protein HG1285_08416 [Hydrogenivirga sp. 128-5-R1-1]
MSYSKSLEDFVLRLKGGVFFLSPRERLFLKLLEDMGVPEHVAREGIERCYTALNPRRRSKHPLFMCFRNVMEAYENHLRLEAQRVEIDWKKRFEEKVRGVKKFVNLSVKDPESEKEAQEILKKVETELFRELWKQLSKEEKREIKEKFKEFRDNKAVFGELVKRELQKRFGVPTLSLYVD